MPTKVRKQIYLDPRQNRQLKYLAKARGVSEAEIIRGLLDTPAADAAAAPLPPNPAAWEAIRQFIERRSHSPAAGTPYHWDREAIYAERAQRGSHRVNDAADSPTSPAAPPRPAKTARRRARRRAHPG